MKVRQGDIVNGMASNAMQYQKGVRGNTSTENKDIVINNDGQIIDCTALVPDGASSVSVTAAGQPLTMLQGKTSLKVITAKDCIKQRIGSVTYSITGEDGNSKQVTINLIGKDGTAE